MCIYIYVYIIPYTFIDNHPFLTTIPNLSFNYIKFMSM